MSNRSSKTAAIIFLSIMSGSTVHAACNMGEDAKNITELNFGQVDLYGFPAGSLKVAGQHALPNFDSWPFSLKVKNNRVGVSMSAPGSVLSAPLRFNGTMEL